MSATMLTVVESETLRTLSLRKSIPKHEAETLKLEELERYGIAKLNGFGDYTLTERGELVRSYLKHLTD